MTYKNWDHVRDHRLYSYLNQQELDDFLEAMRLQDLSQQSAAVRTFVNERSQQILTEHRAKQFKQPSIVVPGITYQFPSGGFTASAFGKGDNS